MPKSLRHFTGAADTLRGLYLVPDVKCVWREVAIPTPLRHLEPTPSIALRY